MAPRIDTALRVKEPSEKNDKCNYTKVEGIDISEGFEVPPYSYEPDDLEGEDPHQARACSCSDSSFL